RDAALLVDAQELVVLREPLAARRRARLDLTDAGRDREVGDEGVVGLAAAMRDHRSVSRAPRALDGVERLGERPDLVQLDEHGVGDAALDAAPDPLDVGVE